MQAALIQDAAQGGAAAKLLRIVTVDIATGATHEYGYELTSGSGVNEIVALNDHEFLVDERDGKGLGSGSNAKSKQVFKIDLAGAVDITGMATQHTLWVASDNDFVPDRAGPNQFYVFSFTDADLNGSPLVPQALPDGRRTSR